MAKQTNNPPAAIKAKCIKNEVHWDVALQDQQAIACCEQWSCASTGENTKVEGEWQASFKAQDLRGIGGIVAVTISVHLRQQSGHLQTILKKKKKKGTVAAKVKQRT